MSIQQLNDDDMDKMAITVNFDDLNLDLSGRDDLAQLFGQKIIDRIIERTRDENKGFDGRGFKKYSDSYVESEAFTAYGKSQGEVDLTLTGNMLDSIDVKDFDENKVVIGFIDTLESNKAFGHMTGMRGHDYLAGKVPERKFFGVNDKELKQIAKEIKREMISDRTFDDVESLLDNNFTSKLGQEILSPLKAFDDYASFLDED
jgi:phage gpG-like protein